MKRSKQWIMGLIGISMLVFTCTRPTSTLMDQSNPRPVFNPNPTAVYLSPEESMKMEANSDEWIASVVSYIRYEFGDNTRLRRGLSPAVKAETDPIWATGWDHKSVLLGVRDQVSAGRQNGPIMAEFL